MQQFKQASEDALSNLERFSSSQLSLLNSRRRPLPQPSEPDSELQRQNEAQIQQFKRQIEERFKLSIANKIYTFPKVIKTLRDIISSDQQPEPPKRTTINNREIIDLRLMNKHKNMKPNDHSRLYESNNENRPLDSTKKGREKLKTNDSTGKRFHPEQKQIKTNTGCSQKKSKKRIERLKTEQDSYLETIRSKAQKKN